MYFGWRPYVSMAEKLAKARAVAKRLAKKEKREPMAVQSQGRNLATKCWGRAWCENLEQYSDFANRLPRGRRYLRNGSVVDLQIQSGVIKAVVAGSEPYLVSIKIKTLAAKVWKSLQYDCSSSIHSLMDLLQGRFDEGVMRRLAQPEGGLFPYPKEIEMSCSCPDYAAMCKHISAVMYGVGVRLDTSPELLFTLRNVDHLELVAQAIASDNLEQTLSPASETLAGSDLGELFGITLESAADSQKATRKVERPRRTRKRAQPLDLDSLTTTPVANVPAARKRRRPVPSAKPRGSKSRAATRKKQTAK